MNMNITYSVDFFIDKVYSNSPSPLMLEIDTRNTTLRKEVQHTNIVDKTMTSNEKNKQN